MPYITHEHIRKEQNLFCISDLLKLTGVSPAYFYRRMREGSFPSATIQVGKRCYWTSADAMQVVQWWADSRNRTRRNENAA